MNKSLVVNITHNIIEQVVAQLKEEGWTPPEKKEFKVGDIVEVKENPEQQWFGPYKYQEYASKKLHRVNGTTWKYCRHAPTWIKWEKGPIPDERNRWIITKGHGSLPDYQCLGPFSIPVKQNISRWAWMPEED